MLTIFYLCMYRCLHPISNGIRGTNFLIALRAAVPASNGARPSAVAPFTNMVFNFNPSI